MFDLDTKPPSKVKGRLFYALAAACALACVTMCSFGLRPPKQDFVNIDITSNREFANDFSLLDTDGHTRTLANYRGKVVVLVFGYTHCPDVCPETLAQIAQARHELGAKRAQNLQVLFVTLDPERDSATVLKQYTEAFDPSFRGMLPASATQLEQTANSFRVGFKKIPGESDGTYTMSHTAASFVFDAQGSLRLYARDGQGVQPWVHDLGLLLPVS